MGIYDLVHIVKDRWEEYGPQRSMWVVNSSSLIEGPWKLPVVCQSQRHRLARAESRLLNLFPNPRPVTSRSSLTLAMGAGADLQHWNPALLLQLRAFIFPQKQVVKHSPAHCCLPASSPKPRCWWTSLVVCVAPGGWFLCNFSPSQRGWFWTSLWVWIGCSFLAHLSCLWCCSF